VSVAITGTSSRAIVDRLLGRSRVAATADQPVVRMRDVGKVYPNGRAALREVNLTIPEGDFVFLVGPSGAGKSTLMKLLIRDEKPTSGTVVVDGLDLARLPRRKVPLMRRRIGTIFQDFKLLPTKNVRENVAFALEVTGTPRRQIRAGGRWRAGSRGWACRVRPTSSRRSSRGASSSEPPSRGPWSTTHG
jgi:predicted ABC-type transport system involved in lysophospholipase L1 biosynthesis ATPase subunit